MALGASRPLTSDESATLLVRFMVQHLSSPRTLVVAAWLWLAAEADDIEEKRRCLEAVLELNPESQSVRAALALLYQRQIRDLDPMSIAYSGCEC